MKYNMRFFKEKNLLNTLSEYTFIFPIEENAKLGNYDMVVVNNETGKATLPKKKSGYTTIGRVVRFVTDSNGIPSVICKNGIYMSYNTFESEYTVTQKDVGKFCYFEDDSDVSMNSENRSIAGKVLNVVNDKVIFETKTETGVCRSTKKEQYKITNDDVGRYCYFENKKTVSLNKSYKKIAGKVSQVIDGSVIFEVETEDEL